MADLQFFLSGHGVVSPLHASLDALMEFTRHTSDVNTTKAVGTRHETTRS